MNETVKTKEIIEVLHGLIGIIYNNNLLPINNHILEGWLKMLEEK